MSGTFGPAFLPRAPPKRRIERHHEHCPGCNEILVLNVTTKRSSAIPPMTSLAAAKSGSASANTFAVARRLDALAIATLVVVAVIAAFTFRDYGLGWDDYTHSQYGSLLVSLYKSGFADKRALSFVNLYMYGGGFDLLATLSAKVLPFGPVRDAPVGRRRGRPRRPFRHLAAGAPSRRLARRFDRASTARRLPALLRSYVHEREGHALRGGHGDRARSASCARSTNIRARRRRPSRCAASASASPSDRASWAALR